MEGPKIYATLIKGTDYTIRGRRFLHSVKTEIDPTLAVALRANPNFKLFYDNRGDTTRVGEIIPETEVILYYLPAAYYDYMKQRPHHLLEALSAHNITCIYCDPGGPGYYRKIKENLFIAPAINPIPTFKNKISIAYFSFPGNFPLLEKLKPDYIVFDSIDTPDGVFKHWAKYFEESVSISDMVIASAKDLYGKVSPLNRNCVLIPNGVDYDRFCVASDKAVGDDKLRGLLGSKSVIGFHGSLASWLDIDLILETAKIAPDLTFLIVGPDFNVKGPTSHENIVRIPYTPYEELVPIIALFDVGIIPFKASTIADGCNPLKLWELLAAGKPVVATNLKETIGLSGVRSITSPQDGPISFLRELRHSLGETGTELVDARKALAYKNSWVERGGVFYSALAEFIPELR